MKTKKWLYLLLACLMVVSVAGCTGGGGGTGQAAGTTAAAVTTTASAAAATSAAGEAATTAAGGDAEQDPYPGQKTFHIIARMQGNDRTEGDYNQKELYKLAEEETGIHIDWDTVLVGTEDDRMPILLASDLPDAFMFLVSENHILKNPELFASIEGIMRENCPGLVSGYDSIPNFWEMMRFPDGNMYSLPTGFSLSYENDPEGIIFINTQWMDTLGIEFPTNTDEFYDLLVAFRDGDPNGNGAADEIPITFQASGWVGGILYYANPWGIAGRSSGDSSAYFKVENSKIVPNINTPQFRAYLEFMNKCAKEGLLDVEGFSQTGAQQSSKIEEGVVGMYSGWLPGGERVNYYKALPPFDAVGFEGQYKHHGQYQKFRGMRTSFTITTSCNDPANLLRWWEFCNKDTKMRYIGRYGAEGILWEMREDGKIYTIYEDGPEGMSREDMKYTYGLVDGGPLILPSEPEINDPEKYPDSIYREYACDTYLGYYMDEFLPIRFVDPEKNTEKSFMETEINEYMKEFIATSITDTIDDSTWAAHLARLEALNMDTWLQWYQDFVDGKF